MTASPRSVESQYYNISPFRQIVWRAFNLVQFFFYVFDDAESSHSWTKRPQTPFALTMQMGNQIAVSHDGNSIFLVGLYGVRSR